MTLLLLALLACIDERACTTIAVYSTTVTVTDPEGVTIEGATLTYSLDGDAPQPCEEYEPGAYACGLEASGHFEITATKTGYADVTGEVDVSADECHPIPEALTLVMEQSDCTAEAVASVAVHLTGSSGEALEDPAVSYTIGADGPTVPCASADGVDWTCGEEITGDLRIDASASGHQPESVPVTVALDEAGCHPVTESIDIALEWSAD